MLTGIQKVVATIFWASVICVMSVENIACFGDQDNANGDERPRILVTNDDGIQSPGIRLLAKSLSEFADVVVCAPDSNRSGAGQSVPHLNRPMTVAPAKVDGAGEAFAVSGSPADAVCYAIVVLGKEKPFDFVVSGVNSSANVGDQSHSSGTVGAAMEGVYRGVPSIAVSQDGGRDQQHSADFAAKFVKVLKKKEKMPGVVYSINVPRNPEDIKGVAVRPMGGTQIDVEDYETLETNGDVRTVKTKLKFNDEGPDGTDTGTFFSGYITITPLQFDWTAHEAVNEMKSWNLKNSP